jgi:hypothetical protein
MTARADLETRPLDLCLNVRGYDLGRPEAAVGRTPRGHNPRRTLKVAVLVEPSDRRGALCIHTDAHLGRPRRVAKVGTFATRSIRHDWAPTGLVAASIPLSAVHQAAIAFPAGSTATSMAASWLPIDVAVAGTQGEVLPAKAGEIRTQAPRQAPFDTPNASFAGAAEQPSRSAQTDSPGSCLCDPQQPPSEESEPKEPRNACSAYRRAVTDQAERDAHSQHDRHDHKRRKPHVAPLRKSAKGERE